MEKLTWMFFPLATSSNLFSVTALLIFFGVTGKLELAADVAVVQGAALSVFLAFSGNSRNILLSETNKISFSQLVRFRGLFVFPFGLAVYFLCKSTSDAPDYLILALLVRRCTEWLAELVVTDREVARDYVFAQRYVLIQAITFSPLLLNGFVANEVYSIVFFFWAVSPAFLGGRYFLRASRVLLYERVLPEIGYILHLGSSWALATSTFLFRLMILTFASKAVGGELFTAFAIGGMLSAVYTYVIGPSLVSKETLKTEKLFQVVVWLCVCVGAVIVLVANTLPVQNYGGEFFIQTVGFSLTGGAIMIVAQRQRVILLQVKHKTVFVPDLLAGILIVATVPLSFYLAGVKFFTLLFLCNALLTWMLYSLVSDKNESKCIG